LEESSFPSSPFLYCGRQLLDSPPYLHVVGLLSSSSFLIQRFKPCARPSAFRDMVSSTIRSSRPRKTRAPVPPPPTKHHPKRTLTSFSLWRASQLSRSCGTSPQNQLSGPPVFPFQCVFLFWPSRNALFWVRLRVCYFSSFSYFPSIFVFSFLLAGVSLEVLFFQFVPLISSHLATFFSLPFDVPRSVFFFGGYNTGVLRC